MPPCLKHFLNEVNVCAGIIVKFPAEVDKGNTTRLFTGQGRRERDRDRNCQSQEKTGELYPYTSKGVKSLPFKMKEIDSQEIDSPGY